MEVKQGQPGKRKREVGRAESYLEHRPFIETIVGDYLPRQLFVHLGEGTPSEFVVGGEVHFAP